MSKLKDFLIELASDPVLMETYRKDPVATMKKYGVTDAESAAVMNDDREALKKITGEEDFQHFLLINKFDE